MSNVLGLADRTALLKSYAIDVAEGHLRAGMPILFLGISEPGGQRSMRITIGTRSTERLCPISYFVAEGMIAELADSRLHTKPQLGHAIAHLGVKVARMYVESGLVACSITATIEGDGYEVLPKLASIEAASSTTISQRLSVLAHDSGAAPM